MFDSQRSAPASAEPLAGQILAASASSAIGAIIEAGASLFIAEPWRIARIIRGADDMMIDELMGRVAKRRRAGPPADINLAIAVAQLSLALKSPLFLTAWADWRRRALAARTPPTDRAL
jgi:hypothetical protein